MSADLKNYECPECKDGTVMHDRKDGTFRCPQCHLILPEEELDDKKEPFNL